MAQTLTSGRYLELYQSLPSTIKAALDVPPISILAKSVDVRHIIGFVEYQLILMAKLVSVSGNLNSVQVRFIAKQLVEMYPNETLADFKLCFERGCMGVYGDVFRMDGIVLGGWMTKYLDEKYQLVEQQATQRPDHTPNYNPDAGDEPGFAEFKRWAKELALSMTKRPDTKPAVMKPKDRREAISRHYTDLEHSIMLDLKSQYGRDHTDKYTGKTLDGHPSFDEWMKMRDEDESITNKQ